MTTSEVTTVIVARDAEETIERCLRSAVAQPGPILLVDDHSSDATASRARAIGGSRLRVVSPERHETIGRARQTGIDAVTTPFLMWLDADDQALPGRAERLLARLEREGTDLVFDAADLHDGVTGEFVRHMPIPAYLQRDPSGVRQFERNVLPSLGWPLVRTGWAQRIGYDPACHGVEDYDFFLRSCMAGGRVGYEPVPGYRQFAYGSSVSRALEARRRGVQALLAKHDYQAIRERFLSAQHPEAIAAWALVAVAMYREDWDAASGWLDEAERTIADPERVLEADGPCPYPDGWRLAFYRGTLALFTGDLREARRQLSAAHARVATAETANNLGVALARSGAMAAARQRFEEAGQWCPGYLDAAVNRAAAAPSAITSHPLRRSPARHEYPVPAAAVR